MPVSTLNGWTSGGLLPSYATVAHILGSSGYAHTAGQTVADATAPPSQSNIPPVVQAQMPGATGTTPGAPTNAGTAATAGLDPNVWGRLGEVAQRRILQAFKNSTGPFVPTGQPGTPETGGLNSNVWGKLGTTVRSRLLSAIKNPLTPTTAPKVNPFDTSTNPFLYGGPTAGAGWSSTPTAGFG